MMWLLMLFTVVTLAGVTAAFSDANVFVVSIMPSVVKACH